MASIRKRSNRWQARVTRKGFPAEVKTFSTKADADRWARSVEAHIDTGGYISRTEAERITLAEVRASSNSATATNTSASSRTENTTARSQATASIFHTCSLTPGKERRDLRGHDSEEREARRFAGPSADTA